MPTFQIEGDGVLVLPDGRRLPLHEAFVKALARPDPRDARPPSADTPRHRAWRKHLDFYQAYTPSPESRPKPDPRDTAKRDEPAPPPPETPPPPDPWCPGKAWGPCLPIALSSEDSAEDLREDWGRAAYEAYRETIQTSIKLPWAKTRSIVREGFRVAASVVADRAYRDAAAHTAEQLQAHSALYADLLARYDERGHALAAEAGAAERTLAKVLKDNASLLRSNIILREKLEAAEKRLKEAALQEIEAALGGTS